MSKQVLILFCALLSARTVLSATDLATTECVDPSFVGSNPLFPTDLLVQAGPNVKILGTTKVQFAQGFTVEYVANYKIVNVTNSASPQVYVLYQCGTPQPEVKSLPNTTMYLSIPLRVVATADTTANGFLAELGLLDRIAYATELSVAPCLQKLYRPTAQGGCQRSLESTKDLTFKGVDTRTLGYFTYSPSGAPAAVQKSVIVVPATSDPGTLSRAEWIKYVSLFFNQEVEANARFGKILNSYNEAKAAAAKAAGSTVPKVAFTDATYLPLITFSVAAYKMQYVQDASGSPLSVDDIETAGGSAVTCSSYDATLGTMVASKCGRDSHPTSRAVNTSTAAGAKAFRDILKQVDVLIDETYLTTPDNDLSSVEKSYGFTAADRTAVKVLADKKVYRLDAHVRKALNASNPLDGMPIEWLETGVVRADLALADFVAAINPAAAPANFKPAYVRNVASTKVVQVDGTDCPLLTACTISSQPICPYVYKDCTSGDLKYVTAASRCGPSCDATTKAPAANTTSTTKNATSTSKNSGAKVVPQCFLLLVLLIASLV